MWFALTHGEKSHRHKERKPRKDSTIRIRQLILSSQKCHHPQAQEDEWLIERTLSMINSYRQMVVTSPVLEYKGQRKFQLPYELHFEFNGNKNPVTSHLSLRSSHICNTATSYDPTGHVQLLWCTQGHWQCQVLKSSLYHWIQHDGKSGTHI